ncbi:6-bladed beta-propeller [Roseivirga misakiensis]|uniref:6-bladed beta-propeller n=1 Tax=Roseivirga misakiensis TaxID=1563681 RepID=A0A1E5SYZ4_9BACT|nr:6-bladed beta-propeller [Roseivirga misakiensis]OEK04336.1 hypothetical protein BFP71_12700 [Roseivirga misakiensis]
MTFSQVSPFLILLPLLFSACSGPNEVENSVPSSDELPQYDIDFNQKHVPLVEFMEDVEFIFLEETPESLFGGIKEVIVSDGSIYLLDSKLIKLMKFRSDGSFVEMLSNRGNGPSQYQQIIDLVLKEDTLIGIDSRRQRVLKWDSNLGFVDSKSLGYRLNDFVEWNKGFLIDINYDFLDISNFNMNNILFLNNDFEIEKAAVPFQNIMWAPGGHQLFNKFGGKVFYRSSLSDTVFQIDSVTEEIEPAYRFSLGEFWLYGTEIKTNEEYMVHYETGFQNIEMLKYLGWFEDETFILGQTYKVPDYTWYGFLIDKQNENQIHYVDWLLGEGYGSAFIPLLLQDGRLYGALDRDKFDFLLDQITDESRSILRNPDFKTVDGENPVLISFKVRFPN